MSFTDCRTRSNAYSIRSPSSRKGSTATTTTIGSGSNFGSDPVRIFEHRRSHPSQPKGFLNQTTDYRFPSSFEDVEAWLDDIIDGELNPRGDDPDQTSSIKILFLDEKRCAKVLGEEVPLNQLLPKLKIADWCTAHYMSTFCHFPLPLNLDGDKNKHHIWDWRYTISHPFDWDMLWVYLPTTRTTIGIMRTWFDGYDTSITQLEAEITSFSGPTLAHPVLLGLFALQILRSDAMANVREKGNRIYEAQTLTAFHRYNRLRETDSDDEETNHNFRDLTRTVIGAACNLTGWANASQQLIKFASFLQEQNKRYLLSSSFDPENQPEQRLCVYVTQQAQKLVGDLEGAYHDIQAWLSTTSFLLQGVMSLLKQQDANAQIELAKDQKRIAEETKRDSTSMTGISVVTMIFLPGTFTASFFALPFFEAQIQQHGLKQFWIYWAVTVPLTFITLSIWTVWTKHMNPPVTKVEVVPKRGKDPEHKV